MKWVFPSALTVALTISTSLAQDSGVPDTLRLDSGTWVTWSLADTEYTVGVWAWSDGDIIAASLGFRLNVICTEWRKHVDSLIALDTFILDPGLCPQIQTFRRSVIDDEYYNGSDNTDADLGYNGALIGIINILPQVPLFPVGEVFKVGDLVLKIRKPWIAPLEFLIEIDSAFYPPGGSFKLVEGAAEGFSPDFVRSEIQFYDGFCCDNECGDVDRSFEINILDAVYLLNAVFLGGPEPSIMELADDNCDGQLDILDVAIIVNFLFRGGPLPCDTDGDNIPDC